MEFAAVTASIGVFLYGLGHFAEGMYHIYNSQCAYNSLTRLINTYLPYMFYYICRPPTTCPYQTPQDTTTTPPQQTNESSTSDSLNNTTNDTSTSSTSSSTPAASSNIVSSLMSFFPSDSSSVKQD